LFEWFEQGCTQSAVFPRGFLEDLGEELALFGLVLVPECRARVAGESRDVEGGGEWDLVGFSCCRELAFDLFLLCLEGACFLVVECCGDAFFESVVVEGTLAVLDAAAFCVEPG